MAHESFEDEEVAQVLNSRFVSIKVDKEERPDIDAVYMNVCQMLTGQGGWPLTIIMTPEKKPVFAGTYFPKYARYHVPGVLDILSALDEQWHSDPAHLLDSADQITELLRQESSQERGTLSKAIPLKAAAIFESTFDEQYGGFGSAPKFPTPHNLLFLLRIGQLEKDSRCLEIVEKTLQQMYRGGIFDHIGFGFSRYSTDEKWLVPHFEKMLYDNALLTIAYLETYQITKKELYKAVAEKIMSYVLRELTHEDGGFFCAQDADSDGEEGKYYVFTPRELLSLLGEKDGRTFNSYFGITDQGNFEGANIPNLLHNLDFEQKNERMDELCQTVFAYRLERTSLHKDDKILTSWNALMIAAFAKAYRILGNASYLRAAERAMQFIESKLMDEQNHLFVRYRDGETSGNGHVDDYAFTVWALLELYDVTFDCAYLEKAMQMNEKLVENFFDDNNGGFYLYGKDSERLISRPKELYDGAIPSGNSVATYNLARLAKLTGKTELQELADRQFDYIASNLQDYPAGYSFALIACMTELYPSREVVCTVDDENEMKSLRTILGRHFLPNTTVLVKNNRNAEKLGEIAEFTQEYEISAQPSYYICENNSCSPPIHSLQELEKRIQ